MSDPQTTCQDHTSTVNALAQEIYAGIADLFPVCAASDEFYFSPQVLPEQRDWRNWDDFSPVAVTCFSAAILNWEQQLAALAEFSADQDTLIDIRLLRQCLQTLREQLTEVAPQCNQPTFHLTIVAAGLGEALNSQDPAAWQRRITGLPAFLERAEGCLEQVPELFLEMGRQMLNGLQNWLTELRAEGRDIGEVPAALSRFDNALLEVATIKPFTLQPELAERIYINHIGSGLGIDAALAVIDQELVEMSELLSAEAEGLKPGFSWREAAQQIPTASVPATGLLELYRHELRQLEKHCRIKGLLPTAFPTDTGLSVATVPACLGAIRASDAYNAEPGHPPRGGTFFVQHQKPGDSGGPDPSLEYRMTAVHETWPGHHLLDWSRWSLERPLRRPLESPLFYEGWACLAEELMARSGYFEHPWDRFLLARRRLKRAARGKVDLGLQTGRMNFSEAVDCLELVGFSRPEAENLIPKYLLRPGYQVCYTLGLRRFLSLLEDYGGNDIGSWISKVLPHGEIQLDDLELKLAEVSQK